MMTQCHKRHELVYRLDEVPLAARTLGDQLGSVSVMTFTGGLGAGKTTLIQELLAQRGVMGVVQSPTFTTVCVYTNAQGYRFYHFDLYRLESVQEFIRSGFHEYLFEPQSYALIEWPEIVMPLLKGHEDKVCHVDIALVNEDARRIRYYLPERK